MSSEFVCEAYWFDSKNRCRQKASKYITINDSALTIYVCAEHIDKVRENLDRILSTSYEMLPIMGTCVSVHEIDAAQRVLYWAAEILDFELIEARLSGRTKDGVDCAELSAEISTYIDMVKKLEDWKKEVD